LLAGEHVDMYRLFAVLEKISIETAIAVEPVLQPHQAEEERYGEGDPIQMHGARLRGK
jgi:hypothetical protein